MFRLSSASRRPSRELRIAVFVLLLFSCAGASLSAQCPPENDPNISFKRSGEKPPNVEPLLPEAGFLSDTHYTSEFFGFGFDLPLTVKGHQIMMPIMPEKQHVLLALQFENDQHNGYIMVTASDPRPGFDVDTPEKQKQEQELEKWSQEGNFDRQNQLPVPSFLMHPEHFYSSFHRNGRTYTAQYRAAINNYMVKVMIATNDQDFLHKAKNVMADAKFYCPRQDGSMVTQDNKPVRIPGEPYYGPTVPTFRVNAAIRDEPAKNIPRGEVVEGVYRNPDVGVQYQPPPGWSIVQVDNSDPPLEQSASRIHRFLHACSQTLLQVAPQRTADQEDPPGTMITLRAIDPNCLSMHTAVSLTDKRTTDEVAATLEQMREFGSIDSDELRTMHGHLFMIFHGTLATAPRGEDLGERMSQSIFATRYNKLLLMWTVLAPNSAAMAEIPASNILFDGSPPIELRASLQAKK